MTDEAFRKLERAYIGAGHYCDHCNDSGYSRLYEIFIWTTVRLSRSDPWDLIGATVDAADYGWSSSNGQGKWQRPTFAPIKHKKWCAILCGGDCDCDDRIKWGEGWGT